LDQLPRYRQKLGAPRTGGLAWPSWERDQRFEIDAHVRHATLPSPGDEPEFLDWLSDFYSHRLDRGRRLWEMVLLDGLAGGRWALVSKTHPCLVDGVGSVDVVGLLLGAKPAPREPSAPQPPASALAWLGWLPHPPEPVGQVAGAGLAAARAGAHTLMHPREALQRSRAVIDLLVRDELIAAPRSSMNVEIGATRRIATVHVELQELQKVRSALGGKVNDVVLCAASLALGSAMSRRGRPAAASASPTAGRRGGRGSSSSSRNTNARPARDGQIIVVRGSAIFIGTFARATKTYGAALLLCDRGYGEQAAMLNRSPVRAHGRRVVDAAPAQRRRARPPQGQA
jgi:diacylglycerol O-acyltransferase / wax synthase